MPRCPPSRGSKGRADRPGQATGRGRTMTDASVSFAGNLTDDPEVRYTEAGIARAMFRVAVRGRREQEASFFTVIVWRDQAEHAAKSLAKGSRVVVVGRSSSEPGPLRMAAPDLPSRSWPTSWDRACAGRPRRRPGRRAARASNQFDHYDGTGRKAKPASVPFRHVYALELSSFVVRSFSTNSRPALRAASGRPPARQPHDANRGCRPHAGQGGTKQVIGSRAGG
jgi:Single-strand binding protein family